MFLQTLIQNQEEKKKSSLTWLVYGHDDRSVLQLYCLPLVELGRGTDGAQHHPQGGPYDRAVVEGQVVAEVPGQVVPKTAMEHDLGKKSVRVRRQKEKQTCASVCVFVPLVVRLIGWTHRELCR